MVGLGAPAVAPRIPERVLQSGVQLGQASKLGYALGSLPSLPRNPPENGLKR